MTTNSTQESERKTISLKEAVLKTNTEVMHCLKTLDTQYSVFDYLLTVMGSCFAEASKAYLALAALRDAGENPEPYLSDKNNIRQTMEYILLDFQDQAKEKIFNYLSNSNVIEEVSKRIKDFKEREKQNEKQ